MTVQLLNVPNDINALNEPNVINDPNGTTKVSEVSNVPPDQETFRGSKESGEQGPIGNIVCGGEGDGIFRGGRGADSKFEWRRGEEVCRKREKNNFRR